MARLNNRPSTIYAPSSRAQTAAPPSSNASNQENYDPRERDPRRDKRPVMDDYSDALPGRTSLPTPTSEESAPTHVAQKRKRPSATQVHDLEDSDEEEDEDEEEQGEGEVEGDADMKKFLRYYDPNQDRKKRQQVKRKSRKLDRDIMENRDEIVRNPELINQHTIHANTLFKHVKQTGDATVDARILVNLSDALYKNAASTVHGDASTGIDVGEFLSKCIRYMKNGGPTDGEAPAPTQTQRTRRRNAAEEASDDDDDTDMQPLDWELLGANACFPYNTRPACPSFLLGPLSVEKKVRAQTQRRARQTKDTSKEARPEALTREEGAKQDENTLTVVCDRIHRHITNHIDKAETAMFRMQNENIPIDQDAFCKKYRITGDGGPGLFDYAINPHSFGETVENFFYISFLIKEGLLEVLVGEEDGMPTLLVKQKPDGEREGEGEGEQRKKGSMKHQAVFALDYETWGKLIEAFEIREPMIPHRGEVGATQGVGGWSG